MGHQNEKTWIYVFVRTDLPIEQVLVQSNHASYEAGLAFDNHGTEPSSLIVLSFPTKEALEEAYTTLTKNTSTKFVKFYEPDWDYGFTAFASEPVTADERKQFRQYKLFRGTAK